MSTNEKTFSVIPLGGLGEIGMNCLAIEVDKRLLLIDCGAMFTSEGLGIDLIHPGFEFLVERRDDIEGVVLTHSHEDHIAGVPFLLREVDVPIYGGAYSLGLLSQKMSDFDAAPKLISYELRPGGQITLGPFAVKTFPMPHSIVENTGLVIDTKAGRILHTGDFKLGQTGPDQGQIVLSRLKEMSDGRVDLMLADSTGSEENELAGDESEVKEAINTLVKSTSGRIFIAIFSSNVKRLQAIAEVAHRHGRQIALCGRSVVNHVRVSSSIGALKMPPSTMIPLERAVDLPRNRSLIIVSGTQGEARSALGRLADNSHHLLRVEKGDMVIMSSRFIPGNELAIGRIIDRLHRLGAEVVHRGIHSSVHVSGHGSKTEIQKAIEVVSPRCFLPVHGTYRHLVSCAALARKSNVDNIAVVADGQVAHCGQEGISVEESRLPPRRIFIDGGHGLNESTIRDRRLLGSHGVLFVSFSRDEDGLIEGPIDIVARGVAQEEALPWFSEQIRDKVQSLVDNMKPEDRIKSDRCRDLLRSALRKYLVKLISREPYVLVSIVSS